MREIPIDKTLRILREEPDSIKAFKKIVKLGNDTLPSSVWNEFVSMNIIGDIEDAKEWLKIQLDSFPDYNGIYLGLDTLNMEDGEGYNIEIGLSDCCNPSIFNAEWSYECPYYGDNHLIKGLSKVSDCFPPKGNLKWSDEEQSLTEYLIFLGYSGIIIRDALMRLNLKNDFLSVWGFHDGDLFFLIQRDKGKNYIVTEVDM